MSNDVRPLADLRPFHTDSLAMRGVRRAYNGSLALLSRRRGMDWTINGVHYRVDSRHRHRLAHQYEETVAHVLAERVRPGELCVNVGANVGAYVLQFAYWSAPTGRVVAFEPNPAAFAVLQRHVKMNALEQRVVTVAAAVADAVARGTLYVLDADGMSRLGAPNPMIGERATTVEVPVITLDNYCEAHNLEPDWLIVDIEGFEIAALRGCGRLIGRSPRLKILVEMHPSIWPSSGTSRHEAEALLEELDLHPERLSGQADLFVDHGQVLLTRK